MLKLKIFVFFLFILTIGIDGRARRKRRQSWPYILAPGGNTFKDRGYYGMDTHIAYPEMGISFNPYPSAWNPYGQGYFQQNPNNIYNSYGYNQPFPYNNGPGVYGGPGMNNILPFDSQNNYNGYFRNGRRNSGYSNNMNPNFDDRTNVFLSQSNVNTDVSNSLDSANRYARKSNGRMRKSI